MTVEDKLHCTAARAAEISQVAECQIFLYVILLMKLIDDGDLRNVSKIRLTVTDCVHDNRPKSSVISFSHESVELTRELLIPSQPRLFTLFQ